MEIWRLLLTNKLNPGTCQVNKSPVADNAGPRYTIITSNQSRSVAVATSMCKNYLIDFINTLIISASILFVFGGDDWLW